MKDEQIRTPVELHIPFTTYLTFLVIVTSGYFLFQLAPFILLLFLSMLIAVTLNSMENVLIKKGWKKWAADSFLILSLLGILSVIIFVVIPNALTQVNELLENLPRLKKEITAVAPEALKDSAGQLMSNSPASLTRIWNQVAVVANHTLTGVIQFAIMLIAAFYMLLDGKRAYAWLLAFFKEKTRERIDATCQEIDPIVHSYIIGQVTTSTMAAIWAFTSAYLLGVPAALTLAVLAAVFDILPGLGFLLNAILGGLLALTVSSETALWMVLSMGAYCVLENYIVIPRIYGKRLKLAPLVVLISLIFAGTVAGIPGMIAILPIVAAYGPIERHWLKRRGLAETVELHREIAETSNEALAAQKQ